MIPVPIRNRAFKDKIGEREEVMMSVVVMRHEVETAMDEHAPRKNDDSLGVQQIIPNPQGDQNQWDGVKEGQRKFATPPRSIESPRVHVVVSYG